MHSDTKKCRSFLALLFGAGDLQRSLTKGTILNTKEKITISKERNVRTYAEMWHTSRVLLQLGKEIEKGAHHHFMGSIVFTAFTLEAYLNHIGPMVFNCWNSIERLSPKDKLIIIAEKIQMDINFGVRPWQVMKDLFGFRNDIAHGKSVSVIEKVTVNAKKFDESQIHEWAKTKWEKYCTEKNAIEARKDVGKITLKLHASANIDELPLQGGLQSATVSLCDDSNTI